jgi:HrpA-like RNA helicase
MNTSKNELSFNKVIPVEYYRKAILSTILKFQVTIVQAETGSGKTIFIPKILYLSGFKKIIISQTKRTATIKAAKFLSSVFNQKIGDLIGYSVRFEKKSKKTTRIKFVTDGILFQNLLNNSFFEKNVCIILDEFHERTFHTDLLIGVLKKILDKRRDLKLIFMSASGNAQKLAQFFKKKVGKIDVPGSLYKIRTFYIKRPQLDYIISLCSVIISLHSVEKLGGDFLVFFPGFGEILECEKMLKFLLEKKKINFSIFKLHSNIPLSEQLNIVNSFSAKKRKIILSTNIAESSLTIKGIKYVLDSGLSKQKIMNWKTNIDLYKISPISKSEAKQRAGRAGRDRDGKCFRLFTYLEYSNLFEYPNPEIQRLDLSSLLLHIFTSKFSILFKLDFINIPTSWIVKRSMENLFVLGAIDPKIKLTWIGKLLSIYPIETRLSRIIIESLKTKNEKIKYYVLLSCSMLSLNFDFSRMKIKGNLGGLNILRKILKMNEECFLVAFVLKKFLQIEPTSKKRSWCKLQKFNSHFFELAGNLKDQLSEINKFSIAYFDFSTKKKNYEGLIGGFRYCFTAGFFQNSARIAGGSKDFQLILTGLIVNNMKKKQNRGKIVTLFLFHELLVTYKISIRGLISTKLPWLLYFGEKLFY